MSEQPNNNQEQEQDLNKLMQVRKEKLDELQAQGKNPKLCKYKRLRRRKLQSFQNI